MRYKTYTLIAIFAVTLACGQAQRQSPNAVTLPAASDLGQDLNEIAQLVPVKAVNRLIIRYLLTDEEFQRVVRSINSPEATTVLLRARQQPELIRLRIWVKQQLQLSAVSEEWDDSVELSLIDDTPFWVQTLPGWQGFCIELSRLVPLDLVKQEVALKASQSSIFAEFLRRVQALAPVYERVINWPEAQRVWARLAELGVDVGSIDRNIRNLLGWQNATASINQVRSGTGAPQGGGWRGAGIFY